MGDKQTKNTFSHISDEELQFTNKNRQRVFDHINEQNRGLHVTKKYNNLVQKILPTTVTLLFISLCLFVFIPSLLSENIIKRSNEIDLNNETNTIAADNPNRTENEYSTSLITVKSKEMDNRTYLNLLLTYNKDKKLMKVVSPNQLTSAPVGKNNDGSILYDKLLFAYNYGGAENVKSTVSKLFNLPIDHYAVIDLEAFSMLIDYVNGIDYDLQEDIQVRAITQVAFDFKKGKHRLNGEEVVALMMATSEFDKLEEGHLVNLMNAVMTKVENEIPPTLLKELFSQIETNTSLDSLLENPIEINSIKSISLKDGMKAESTVINNTTGNFFYQLDKEFLSDVAEELTTFN